MGGGSKKKRESSERFVEQCEALQGVWVESAKRYKQWVISGANAFRVTEVGVGKDSYALCEGEGGGLVWGTKGSYTLDSAFKWGMSSVTWLQAGWRNRAAFTWEYVGPASERVKENADALGGIKGKAQRQTKGWGKGEDYRWATGGAKGWVKNEANDWDMGDARSWSKVMTQETSDDCWWLGGRARWKEWRAGKVLQKRIDPSDGNAYAWEEFQAHYLARGLTARGLKEWWANMALAPNKAVAQEGADDCWWFGGRARWREWRAGKVLQKRIDPSDGNAYAWEEFQAHYLARGLTARGLKEWWANMALAPNKAVAQEGADDCWWPGERARWKEWRARKMLQKRIDPSDKNAYSWEEFQLHYLAQGQTMQCLKEWWANMALAPNKAVAQEGADDCWWLNENARRKERRAHKMLQKRIDPSDQNTYTWEEFRVHYQTQGLTMRCLKEWWANMALTPNEAEADELRRDQGGALSKPERRVDTDGKAYTWRELRACLSPEFTKKATEHYWGTLAPAPFNGKRKTMAMPRSQKARKVATAGGARK